MVPESGSTPALKTALSEVLTQHQLAAAILEGARKAMKETAAPGSFLKVQSHPVRELTESEYFAVACGYSLSHLLGLVGQLEQIPVYIRDYHRSKARAAAGVNRVSDLAYHWENYLIRARALEDRVLHLISDVLHLGINARDVTFNAVRRNAHVMSKEIGSVLDRVHALVMPNSSERNRVIHERGVLDEELRSLEFWLLAQRSLPQHRDLATGRFLSEVRRAVPNKAAAVERFLNEAEPVLLELFDALRPQYSRIANRLDSK